MHSHPWLVRRMPPTARLRRALLSALTYLRERNLTAAGKLANRVDEALRRLDELPIDGPGTELAEGGAVRS